MPPPPPDDPGATDVSPPPPGRAARRADALLMALLGAVAFGLGCYELFDPDVWWHLRSGRWILEHRRVPRLDPFSFASADRPWIDLHWGFQVALALADRLAGVPGMILMAASAATGAFLLALSSRGRDRPLPVVGACWLPALFLMSTRFDPRPEVVSLLAMAAFLAVLVRLERRPALAWALPPLQVLWVNAHALFVLGPILLGCFLPDRLARALPGRRREGPTGGRWWRHVAPASAAVGLACLANPYGPRGARFPLELLPKIAAADNPYKKYIGEFMSLRAASGRQAAGTASGDAYARAQFLLMLMLPTAVLLPAAWRSWRDAPGPIGAPTRPRAWSAALATAVALAMAGALGLPGRSVPGWLVALGRASPALMLAAGAAGAAGLARRDRRAALLVAAGSVAEAAWMLRLRTYLFEPVPSPADPLFGSAPGLVALGAGALAVLLAVREGTRPSRVLLATAFGYLGLQAIRNQNLFGLAAGSVIAWELGDWAARLGADWPSGRSRSGLAWAARALLAAVLASGLALILTDRYYPAIGEALHSGLRERPFTFAHDAARFAGRPGMPGRALVYDLGQTGVYVYHNGPSRKVFMDGRLEVPSLETFRTYTRVEDRLSRGDPRWADAVRGMGDPLILIDHAEDFVGEATVLADPRWRCVYYDALASVYLPRHRIDLEAPFPTIDFAARHFRPPQPPPIPDGPGAALAEAKGLANLGAELRRRPGSPWSLRIPVLLSACDDARGASSPPGAGAWLILGDCHWHLAPDLAARPPAAGDPWDPAVGLTWSQATVCYRRALDLAPGSVPALRQLAESYAVRRMVDARASAASRLRRARSGALEDDAPPESPPLPAWRDAAGFAEAVDDQLRLGRPEAVARLFAEAEARRLPLPWPVADRVAVALLHLGDPAAARRAWRGAVDAPSAALRLARIAASHLAAMDEDAASTPCREALAQDPSLGEAWFVLATLHARLGRAPDALAACRSGLLCDLTAPQRSALEGIRAMAAPFAPGNDPGPRLPR